MLMANEFQRIGDVLVVDRNNVGRSTRDYAKRLDNNLAALRSRPCIMESSSAAAR